MRDSELVCIYGVILKVSLLKSSDSAFFYYFDSQVMLYRGLSLAKVLCKLIDSVVITSRTIYVTAGIKDKHYQFVSDFARSRR